MPREAYWGERDRKILVTISLLFLVLLPSPLGWLSLGWAYPSHESWKAPCWRVQVLSEPEDKAPEICAFCCQPPAVPRQGPKQGMKHWSGETDVGQSGMWHQLLTFQGLREAWFQVRLMVWQALQTLKTSVHSPHAHSVQVASRPPVEPDSLAL